MPKEITLNYKPHPSQARFHLDRYAVFARLVRAGTGSGKTFAGGYEAVSLAMQNPGCVVYAFEPTFKMVKRIMVPLFEGLLGKPLETAPLIQDYNRTDSKITFLNGSTLWMIGLDEPESAEGPNVDAVWSDETRLVRRIEAAWQVWMRRLRGSVPGRFPVGVWLTTTPNEPRSFIFDLFENPKTCLANSRVYGWGIDDNPYLTEEYRAEVKRSHSGGFYRRFVEGLFAPVGTGSFEFDSAVHVAAQLPGEFRRVVCGVDFGWTNPSCIVAVGFDGDGRAYVLDEFYQSRVHVDALADEAREMTRRYGADEFACDSSEPRTIDELNVAGVNASPNKSRREEGIREIGGRLKKESDGKPRLTVSERCVNLIGELQSFDEARKENDHAVDALRYALMAGGGGSMQVLTGKVSYR